MKAGLNKVSQQFGAGKHSLAVGAKPPAPGCPPQPGPGPSAPSNPVSAATFPSPGICAGLFLIMGLGPGMAHSCPNVTPALGFPMCRVLAALGLGETLLSQQLDGIQLCLLRDTPAFLPSSSSPSSEQLCVSVRPLWCASQLAKSY